MSKFNFTVDRVCNVTKAITFHGDAGLMTEPFTVEPGTTVVYRGTVEIGHTARFCFDVGEGKKGYTRDRAALEAGLAEDYDALMKA